MYLTLRDDAVLEEVYYAVVVVVIGWVVRVITMMGLFKLEVVRGRVGRSTEPVL